MCPCFGDKLIGLRVSPPPLSLGSPVTGPRTMSVQFSLWATMAAPLLIGSSILNLTAWDLETYTNAEVIAVDQDPLGCGLLALCSLLALRRPGHCCWIGIIEAIGAAFTGT